MFNRKIEVPPAFRKVMYQLACALRKLEPGQGTVARRNARRLVRAKLRAISDIVGDAFPAPARRAPRRAGRLDPWVKRRRLADRGWKPLDGAFHQSWLRLLAAAGVKVEVLGGETWAPAWALTVDPREASSVGKLKKLRRDRAGQRRALVRDALARDDG